MSILFGILKDSQFELRKLINYCRTYPSISSETELCGFYRKMNGLVPSRLFFITFALIINQIIRIFFSAFNVQSFDLGTVLITYIFVDLLNFAIAFYGLFITRFIHYPENKENLEYQKSIRFKLHLCRIIPAFSVFWIAYKLICSPGCATNVVWLISFMLEIYVCTALLNGIFWRASLILFYNVIICKVIHSHETINENIVNQIILPVFAAIFFFILYNRCELENFKLKHMLKSKSKLYEEFLIKINDPVIILDNHGLVYKNEAAVNDLGISSTNYIPKFGCIVTKSGVSLEETISKYFKNILEISSHEKYFMHDDESDLIQCDKMLDIGIFATKTLSKKTVVYIICRDLTKEFKQQEEIIEAKYKDFLLFSLSHELRTPLNILQDLVYIGKKYKLSSEDIKSYKRGKSAWKCLKNKISDLLDYAQLTTGEFVLHPQIFSIRKYVSKLQRTMNFLLQNKNGKISLKFTVGIFVQDLVEIDKDRLEQVLYNLLLNAIKYTQEGTISLKIEHSEPTNIKIIVKDTGCGISEELLKSINSDKFHDAVVFSSSSQLIANFNTHHEFFEGQDKVALKYGLGLTVSKLICKKMGGCLEAKSKVNKGSSFSFEIKCENPQSNQIKVMNYSPISSPTRCPLVSDEEELIPDENCIISCRKSIISNPQIIHREHKPKYRRGSAIRSKKLSFKSLELESCKIQDGVVLVIDDNEFNRAIATKMVQKFNIRVVQAENGQVGIRKFQEISAITKRMLIFMDIDMPVMNGMEATRKIREMKVREKPYICALTAFASEGERKRAKAEGMDNFVSKPLTKENLVCVLKLAGFAIIDK